MSSISLYFVTLCAVAKRYVVGGWQWYRWIRFLFLSVSTVTMSLSAAVWLQFEMQVFWEVLEVCFISEVMQMSKKQRSRLIAFRCTASPSNSWALVLVLVYKECRMQIQKPMKKHPMHHSPCHVGTQKSWLTCEIKFDLYYKLPNKWKTLKT